MTVQRIMRKRAWLICAITILCLCEELLVLLSTIALIAAFPLGIIMFGLCGLLGWWVVILIKKNRKLKQLIRAGISTHKPLRDIIGNVVYCFTSPFSTQETVSHITNAFVKCGGVVKGQSEVQGYVQGKVFLFGRKAKVHFYVERSDLTCKVRAFFYKAANDDVWDMFLSNLFESCGRTGFDVSLADGKPYIVGVLYLGGETEQVYVSKTTSNKSITGFLLGGALFGAPGAVVGGLSGTQRTYGTSNERFSDYQLMRIIYNNGRIWEGRVKKNSPMYQEIMVNMH